MKTVLESTVVNNLCIGCGICASVCPVRHLRMELNQYGEYNPVLDTPCLSESCQICKSVCPNIPVTSDMQEVVTEDELAAEWYGVIPDIQHNSVTGYHYCSFVGHVTDHDRRIESASGGLLTWTLEQLLLQKKVDHLICVESRADEQPLFGFTVCSSVEELRRCTRSCYYPVEASQIIRYIMENDSRYAMVALPCVAKAVRLAQRMSPRLKERLRYVLGLTCGQGKSVFFVEAVCSLGGGKPHDMKIVHFRTKDKLRPAFDFGIQFQCVDQSGNTTDRNIFFTQGVNSLYIDRHFTLNGCDYCDDIFSECADASFMDAWLPEYSQDWRGSSIVICRTPEIADLFRQGQHISCKVISIKMVIRSQVGNCNLKRNIAPYRLGLATIKGKVVPYRRIKPSLQSGSFLGKIQARIAMRISQDSREKWITSANDYRKYKKIMFPLFGRLRFMRFGYDFLLALASKIKNVKENNNRFFT